MAGDHDAFAALAAANVDRMYGLARLILRDVDRAEDATQEALVRMWRELPRLREPDHFRAWVRRLLVNDAAMTRSSRSGDARRWCCSPSTARRSATERPRSRIAIGSTEASSGFRSSSAP